MILRTVNGDWAEVMMSMRSRDNALAITAWVSRGAWGTGGFTKLLSKT